MKVIGIDPAPAKGLHVFDGQHDHVSINEAASFIEELQAHADVLICWDAPLTGPPETVLEGRPAGGRAFTQRPIERFFRTKATGYKTPKGISVLGYAGCPHRTLSRALLGLPRVGPFDAPLDDLPFGLVTGENPPQSGCHIVEVHPAVALWLWCRDARGEDMNWQYKRNPALSQELWEILIQQPPCGRSTASRPGRLLNRTTSWMPGWPICWAGCGWRRARLSF